MLPFGHRRTSEDQRDADQDRAETHDVIWPDLLVCLDHAQPMLKLITFGCLQMFHKRLKITYKIVADMT